MVFSMFGGGGSGPELRPMQRGDLGGVLKIIAQHDEDDFEEARDNLRDEIDGMFVLVEKGKVIGVTGGVVDPHSDDVVWLSWTYVDIERQGQGLGTKMFRSMLDMLRADGVRKLFINTSDYMDEGEDMYAPARAFYEKMGATLEVTLPDYHAAGESRMTYGLDLSRRVDRSQHPGGGAVRFVDIEELDESDAGWGLIWEEAEGVSDPAGLDPDLKRWVGEARRRNGRILYAAVPSDLCANLNEAFAEAGFVHFGRLLDYFAPNVHQELGALKLR
ncbi:MAG: GNAT family N-acetyltransferase [Alphaproteobacteria bacterium]|nr:GNAT family N-acetyltransferase [Alphaproteobacteria bacterium]